VSAKGGDPAAAAQRAASDRPIRLDLGEEPPVRLSDYAIEDYLALGLFWALALTVFTQFYTRYVLNNSLAWTEEVARYLLICVTFLGSAMAVRKNSHIHVEFFYRWFPRRLARALATAVDLARVLFFLVCAWISWKLVGVMRNQQMASVDWSMGWMYAVVFASFLVMTARALQVAWRHWRQGFSALEGPPEGPGITTA
jgi:TRAP-type C4-dicarboxylate transport system permease small subunit